MGEDPLARISMLAIFPIIRCFGSRMEVPPRMGSGWLNLDPLGIGRRMIKSIALHSMRMGSSVCQAEMAESRAKDPMEYIRMDSMP